MKEAVALAKRHNAELAGGGDLDEAELAYLLEAFRLEFISAKSKVGELQAEKFIQAYEAERASSSYNSEGSKTIPVQDAQSQIPDGSSSGLYQEAIKCPRCESTQVAGGKQGFGLGKAVVGGVLFGGIGLLGGLIGSHKVQVACLRCGHTWTAG